MASLVTPTSTASTAAAQPRLWWHGCVNWLLASPTSQPDDIHNEFLQQRTNKTKTLAVAVLASLLIASLAAALTGATWAYAWVLAELVLGSTRIYLMMKASARAKADGPSAASGTPVWVGLLSVILISAGCYQCVASGQLPLVLSAGVGLANLIGGIASRNAGTPRYGILMICILTLPFAVATMLSPIPFLFIVGLQTPVYTAGMIFLLLENHKILLNLHQTERNNRQMAHHDLLTGLPNRALNRKLFSELLDGPWPEAASPSAAKLTVFCVDLDNFKGVNDRLGHAAGDAVLVAVADRLRASVREADVVCRVGGDEFVILLPDITDTEAADIARRITARVAEPFEFAPAARVGASIGLATAPQDGMTADELLSAADRAMYEAKRRGKGSFVIHTRGVEEVTEVVPLVPTVKAPALAD
ncbi:GGDEF domain-containing protein [Bradyrhizobium sp. Ec3.3]|uniref:GGDEF domain-containing protein n=1 Tax=Bradyrhizobium sp. Ec3.3 TaxID=189753 RepID=UPI000A02EA4B|nr:GGDEF domain-containing protein [Bradyrhizobium sp. Ec3.3]